jgi:hypothetical protein
MEGEEMFVIALGNPFEGLLLFGSDQDGQPFEDHEAAVRAAEEHFDGDTWYIVRLEPLGPDPDRGEVGDKLRHPARPKGR